MNENHSHWSITRRTKMSEMQPSREYGSHLNTINTFDLPFLGLDHHGSKTGCLDSFGNQRNSISSATMQNSLPLQHTKQSPRVNPIDGTLETFRPPLSDPVLYSYQNSALVDLCAYGKMSGPSDGPYPQDVRPEISSSNSSLGHPYPQANGSTWIDNMSSPNTSSGPGAPLVSDAVTRGQNRQFSREIGRTSRRGACPIFDCKTSGEKLCDLPTHFRKAHPRRRLSPQELEGLAGKFHQCGTLECSALLLGSQSSTLSRHKCSKSYKKKPEEGICPFCNQNKVKLPERFNRFHRRVFLADNQRAMMHGKFAQCPLCAALCVTNLLKHRCNDQAGP